MLEDLDIKYRNTYDVKLSETSTNAVQNQAVTKKFKELDEKNTRTDNELTNIKSSVNTALSNSKSYTDSKISETKIQIDSELNKKANQTNVDETVDELNKSINLKVDKVSGKGLSTNDFNDNYKSKLDNLDSSLNSALTSAKSHTNSEITKVDNKIKSEISRAQASETNLSNRINNLGEDVIKSLNEAKEYTDALANGEVKNNTNKINILNGTGEGSVIKTVKDEISNLVGTAPEKLNTLQEIADYLEEHEDMASGLVKSLSSLEQNKVDKVPGKGLSTEDYTTEEKNKLAGLNNYDDTAITAELNKKADKEEVTAALNTKADKNETDTKLAELSAEVNGNSDFNIPTMVGVGLGYSQKFPIDLLQGSASVLFTDNDGVISANYISLNFYDANGNSVLELGINKLIYKTFAIDKDVKAFAVYSAANSVVKDGYFSLQFKDNDGLKNSIRDDVSILKEQTSGLASDVLSITDVLGEDGKKYTGDALTESGYVGKDGYINKGVATYVMSSFIPVGVGTTITCTTNISPSVSCVALYDKDKNWKRSLVGTNVQKTQSIVVEEGESYMIMTSLTSLKSEYKVEVTGYGIKNDIVLLSESQNGLQDFVEKIEPILFPSVGDFYLNAWVRYSDGYISTSSGGAKLYIIKRDDYPNAKKITAKVCTEQTIFAAIAFYSSDSPATASYIKEASIQGTSSTNTDTFVADIPEGCKSIIVLNMSQLQSTYEIQVDSPAFLSSEEGKELIAKYLPIFNPFADKDMYYHFNQENEASRTYIPAQSLADIEYAARLGFNMIEANIHACSDGVFLCKHGSGGKFGKGIKSNNGTDYSDVLISSISSQEARQQITYDSLMSKYNTPIPTLNEFAETCKKHNLAIKVEYAEGVLPLLRQYFTDDKIFFTQMQSRGDFKGLIEVIWNPTMNMTDFEKKCKDLGHPLQVIIQSGYWDNLTTEQIKNIVLFCHERGYTIAVPYLLASQWVTAKSLGVDVNLSCYASIPSFAVGNRKNISTLKDAELIKEGGATYDAENDIIVMPKGSTIKILADSITLGAVSVDMMYKGDITLVFGQSAGTRNVTCASGDFNALSYASAIYPQSSTSMYSDEYLTITANEETTLQSISIRCSDF